MFQYEICVGVKCLYRKIFFYKPRNSRFRFSSWCGSLCAAICLQLLFFIFPVYVHLFMTNYVGQIGFLIVTLLLFYVVGLIFIMGAQINAFFFDDIQPLADSIGNALNRLGDQENIRLLDSTVNTPTSVDRSNSIQ